MPQRKADSVLPEPVGARISVCSPLAMAGQPCACAGVASGNDVLEPGSHRRRERLERIRRGHGSRLPTPPDTACQGSATGRGGWRSPTVSVPTMFGWMSQRYS